LTCNPPDFIDLAGDEANIKKSSWPKLHHLDNEVNDDDIEDSYDELPKYIGLYQICFCDAEREFITLDCYNQEVHKHCIVHWASTDSACHQEKTTGSFFEKQYHQRKPCS
jgi:hypothetical protein